MQNKTSDAVDTTDMTVKARKTPDAKKSLWAGLAWLVSALCFTVLTVDQFFHPHRLLGMPSWVFNSFVACSHWFLSLFWLRRAYKLR